MFGLNDSSSNPFDLIHGRWLRQLVNPSVGKLLSWFIRLVGWSISGSIARAGPRRFCLSVDHFVCESIDQSIAEVRLYVSP